MTDVPFEPRLALASLSGAADAAWARAGAGEAGAAFLGGVALDEPSRAAARDLVARGRSEFLPDDPFAFVAAELDALSSVPIRPGVNVRATTPDPIERVASICADRNALLEINAHCRQDELCAVGCGESLLRDTERLVEYVDRGAAAGAETGVKVRAEVGDVDLVETVRAIEAVGASFVHVDAMDTESCIASIAAATDLVVIANNGVRDAATVREYVGYGADAVSIGRPSDDPRVRERVARAVVQAFGEATGTPVEPSGRTGQ
ncbi:dihydropyrimidine dehydrogenase [Halovivax limisalsi]|uniref:dihydropyrimidine dehydrogenase n=1 Tax=Halovivax limisalsi TaxID=1453760 RepID=UPI001FFCB9EA|nr:dihydropyrimidine dehydrogenase [Halovivax limisalsi]